MPKIEVYCTVSSCDYWGKENHCMAEKILIVTDQQADQWPDQIDAPLGSNLQQAQVQTCSQTACKTFRPRHFTAGPVRDQRQNNQYLAGKFPH